MSAEYKTAMDVWADCRSPYGTENSSPVTPHKPRSILKDLAYGILELYRPLIVGPWSKRIETIALSAFGFPVKLAYSLAFWATWEKLATFWSYTTAVHELQTKGSSSPPAWHRRTAVVVGLFWGSIAALIWLFALAIVLRLTR